MACRTSPTTVVNHTYQSLPHTPLINNGSQISHHNRLHHQQPKEQHDRRRSYGGEKKSENNIGGDEHLLGSVKLAKQVPTEAPLLPPLPPLPPPLIEPDAPCASGSYSSSTAAASEAKQRFRLRPLVISISSENFNHLKRAAMETVTSSVELYSSQAIPIEWVLILIFHLFLHFSLNTGGGVDQLVHWITWALSRCALSTTNTTDHVLVHALFVCICYDWTQLMHSDRASAFVLQ